MNDRARQFRLHKEALERIKKSKSRANTQKTKGMDRKTLHGKYQKEEQDRITRENAKMVRAIKYCSPVIDRVEFYEHELDHEHQVQRMTSKPINYGYEIEQRKRPHKTFEDVDNEQETTSPAKKPTKTSTQKSPQKTSNKPVEQPEQPKEDTSSIQPNDATNPPSPTKTPQDEPTEPEKDSEDGKLEKLQDETADALLG